MCNNIVWVVEVEELLRFLIPRMGIVLLDAMELEVEVAELVGVDLKNENENEKNMQKR